MHADIQSKEIRFHLLVYDRVWEESKTQKVVPKQRKMKKIKIK